MNLNQLVKEIYEGIREQVITYVIYKTENKKSWIYQPLSYGVDEQEVLKNAREKDSNAILLNGYDIVINNKKELYGCIQNFYNMEKKEEKEKNNVIFEICPHCDQEIPLEEKKEKQLCHNCEGLIKPCSLCDLNEVDCNNCYLDDETDRQSEKLKLFIESQKNTIYHCSGCNQKVKTKNITISKSGEDYYFNIFCENCNYGIDCIKEENKLDKELKEKSEENNKKWKDSRVELICKEIAYLIIETELGRGKLVTQEIWDHAWARAKKLYIGSMENFLEELKK